MMSIIVKTAPIDPYLHLYLYCDIYIYIYINKRSSNTSDPSRKVLECEKKRSVSRKD